MNKVAKKVVLSALVIFYNIASLFWCYVLIKSLILNFCNVKVGKNGLEIISGADMLTLMFKVGNILQCVFPILFVVLSLGTAFLLTVSSFKKQTNPKLSILLCVFSALTVIVFKLIPTQTYVIPLYILVTKISFLKHSQIFYILISVIVIITNILFVIKKKDFDDQKVH